ncbi:hypothetical protein A9Q99_04765 [Gammaproteobacteria bacterium 45_16_T64]|nr:hypothetical protein A9Q99_04765 [Gammaproteobacteria bacterium 45_16_T64]
MLPKLTTVSLYLLIALILTPNAKADTDWSLVDLLEMKVYSVHKSDTDYFTTPAAVTLITRDDIKNSSARNVPDLLVSVPGLYTFQHQSNLSSVGIRDDAQVFVSTSLVLLDGTPIYSIITGGPEFQTLGLTLDDIERIEIIRGSGGNSWGANASSGVINIITRNAENITGTKISLSTSSRSTHSSYLQHDISHQAFHGYISLGYEHDPGFDNDADNESNYSRKFLRLRGDFEDQRWKIMSSFSATYNGNQDENFYSHSAGDHEDTENVRRSNLLLIMQAQYHIDNQDTVTLQSSLSQDDAERRFLPADYYIFLRDMELRYMRSWTEQNTTHTTLNHRSYDIEIDDLTPTLYGYDPNEEEIYLTAFGFNHIYQLSDAVALDFGGRAEDYSILNETLYSPAGRISFESSESLFFWGSYTKSYQFPNYVQYANYLIIDGTPPPLYLRGSTTLDAEENDDYGVGIRWKNDKNLIDLAIFYKETEGQIRSDSSKITLVPGPPASLTLPYTNTIDVISKGWEASWTRYFSVNQVSTLDITYFTSAAEISGAEDSPRSYSFVPEYKVSWTHRMSIGEKIELSSALIWYDRYASENINGIFAEPNWIDPHYRLDANVKYLLTDNVSFDLGAKNIFSREKEANYPISTQHPEDIEPSLHITLNVDI